MTDDERERGIAVLVSCLCRKAWMHDIGAGAPTMPVATDRRMLLPTTDRLREGRPWLALKAG